MKSSVIRFYAVLLLIACLLVFPSCGKEPDAAGTCTVVIDGDGEYTVDLSAVSGGEGLFSVLTYLKEQGKITFTAETSVTGAYLTAIQGLSNGQPAGSYLVVWTSVEADADVTGMFGEPFDYNGMTLYPSGVGVSQMTVRDGAVYRFGMVSFG